MESACVLQWLYHCGAVGEILEQCRELRGTEKCVYKLVFSMDVCKLLQFNAHIGECVLHSPQSVWRVFVEVVYNILTVTSALSHLSSPSQLLLVIRLTSLPSLPPYVVDQISDLCPLSREPRFYTFSGVVTGMSTRETYTEAVCFYCSSQTCPDKQHYIRLHVAGATEASIMQDTTCHQCGEELTEEMAYRRLADKVYLTFVPCRALCSRASGRYQGMTFVLRGDLCDLVRVGGVYDLIGVPTHSLSDSQHTSVVTLIEVNNVAPLPPSPIPPLSQSLTDLYKACQYSPWIFSATLAYSFAGHICPPGTFHRLKLAMLLSLVSTSSDRHRVLDLLAVGSDSPLLGQLLLYGSLLAKRSIVHSLTSDLYGVARKEESHVYIDGGGLLLAEGGVCLLGNIGNMKKDHRDKLERVLESGRLDVSVPKRFGVSDVQVVSFPMRSTVWGTSSQQSEKSTVNKSIIDCVSLVVPCDSSPSNEDFLTAQLIKHAIDTATGHMYTPLVSHDLLKELVVLCSSIEACLDKEASMMLESFYYGSRRVRGAGTQGTPITALNSLIAITLSHAKLNLRHKATCEDAALAILLYEESLVGRCESGYSVLNISPSPHFRDSDVGAYLGAEFDGFMKDLMKRIFEFCKCASLPSLQREE